jgi:hypothetical protein
MRPIVSFETITKLRGAQFGPEPDGRQRAGDQQQSLRSSAPPSRYSSGIGCGACPENSADEYIAKFTFKVDDTVIP